MMGLLATWGCSCIRRILRGAGGAVGLVGSVAAAGCNMGVLGVAFAAQSWTISGILECNAAYA